MMRVKRSRYCIRYICVSSHIHNCQYKTRYFRATRTTRSYKEVAGGSKVVKWFQVISRGHPSPLLRSPVITLLRPLIFGDSSCTRQFHTYTYFIKVRTIVLCIEILLSIYIQVRMLPSGYEKLRDPVGVPCCTLLHLTCASLVMRLANQPTCLYRHISPNSLLMEPCSLCITRA